MTTRTAAALTSVAVVAVLAACASTPAAPDAEPSTVTTSASTPTADEQTASATATPTVEAEVAPPPLPDGPVAVGQVADNGHLAVVIPDGYSPAKTYDGGLQFNGSAIPESVLPDGVDVGMTSAVGMFPVGTSWHRGLFVATDPHVTRTVYSVSIPGAESAVLEFLSLDQPLETAMNGGGTRWTGRMGSGVVWVVAGGQTSGVHVLTHPGQAGLDFAAAVARTVTVIG